MTRTDPRNVMGTAHIASASVGWPKGMGLIAARNLLADVKEERMVHCAKSVVYETG